MLRSCLIDGSPLQIAHQEFCLWWLRRFENDGNATSQNIIKYLLQMYSYAYWYFTGCS